ncbi:hypothetical protein ACFOD0_15020 [Shewanella intestini]|uniref:Uncharacterized protein n=1 Tax=Shewanella intestini TaxID=2017544 RepID=A0ABS5I5V9_9GAMM|nr:MULTISPECIES: hypothetical protein [Shewanella]MBR9729412.1 hypothetical protein [Shewanella intestini]MRG37492.1 hypothetical protein [Shewanella sp. XMDDZSB0408]
MIKTLRQYKKKIREKLLFVVALIALLLLVYMGLQYWAHNRDIYQFECKADAYNIDESLENGEIVNGDLLLELKVKRQHLVLTYYSIFDDDVHEFVAFEGDLQEVEVGSMTYNIEFEATDVELTPYSLLYPYLKTELEMGDNRLSYGYRFEQNFSVVKVDSMFNFMLIKFTPSNSLWGCEKING